MQRKTRDQHLFDPGPKRILSLDGGGLRGFLTLAYLEELEATLRNRYDDDPDFRLSDYFDLIGGTSTGAIIASLLAIGLRTDEISKMYWDLGRQVFRKKPWRMGVFSPKFETAPLKSALAGQLGDMTLGSEDILTGLVLVSKRLDTNSLWPMHNNPHGRYYETPDDDPTAKPNKNLLLRDVVRASCAAPHYFEPEPIEIGSDLRGAFVDGGVSPYNNPSLLLLMFATLEGYGVNWRLGQDDLLLVSIGTGYQEIRYETEEVMSMKSAFVAMRSLGSILHDCSVQTQTLLQWLAYSPMAREIDPEVGDLANDRFAGAKWATYLRYDVPFQPAWLEDHLKVKVTASQAEGVFAMDRFENCEMLAKIGQQAARMQLAPEHLADHFDPT